jgi:diguanylate cyclase (GGDEF)-like protein
MANKKRMDEPTPTGDAPVPPLLEPLLAVHSARTSNWLADAVSTAAERGLGALYGLMFLMDASGHLAGVRPASSERVRALVKLRQTLDVDLTAYRFDPQERPAILSALQGGHAVAVAELSQALPLSREGETLRTAQRRLGIAEVWLAPLYWDGQSLGLLLLLMPEHAPSPLAHAELLGRHVAVALGNLREEEEGRKRGELDAVRWVYDERRFMEQLALEIRRAERHQRPLSVLLLRVVNLAELRARFGRFLAERVLRQVAGRLADAMRDTDFLGAFGSDGLATILVEADREGARKAEERLLASLSSLELPYADLPDLDVDLLCATATLPEDGANADELAAAAEARLAQGTAKDNVA